MPFVEAVAYSFFKKGIPRGSLLLNELVSLKFTLLPVPFVGDVDSEVESQSLLDETLG